MLMSNRSIHAATDSGPNFIQPAAAPVFAAAIQVPQLTTAPVTAGAAMPAEREWISLPPPGKECPLTGMRRGLLYGLIQRKLIKSVTLRHPGTTRGRRLIYWPSLRDYLRNLDAVQNGGAK